MPFRAAFRTFGCKLNQLETEALAGAFRDSGALLVPFSESADVYVVNTCTVTGKAEQKARREIRRALRTNPRAVVLVTGCWAELGADEVSALGPRTVVIPGSRKDDAALLASDLAEAWEKGMDLAEAAERGRDARSGRGHDPFAFRPETFLLHSRASLKVQDGCDNRCAYCRVCLARGPSRSLAPGEVVERARSLSERGAREIVLTGVNLSQYRSGGLAMPGLLSLLVRETEGVSYRLSSWEPDRVDEEFLAAFSLPRVRNHLHLAVQSGCDAVLARMGRGYRSDAVRRAVRDLRAAKPDPFLGADLIAGFPGETEAEFRTTFDLAAELDFAWIHAFPFSPRPGTKAFGMRPRVAERIAGERVEALLDLGRRGREAYAARSVGRLTRAVLEDPREEEGPEPSGGGIDFEGGPDPAREACADPGSEEVDVAAGSGAPRVSGIGAAPALPEGDRATAVSAVSDEYLRLEVTGIPEALRRRGAEVACRIAEAFPGAGDLGIPDARAEFVGS
ncbi:MAG: tRNA (N(6)-L-threonylcarbamoyladenosine(37)-C(2))-methylthiotransferase MtaB [Treponema sp.]|nr:tRNA (N(6)-L-threonylcarbamoyladenosine(37)-C(2))-methylthiotransferase MtaB [Treponema sp.]